MEDGIPFLSTQNILPFRKGFDFSIYRKYISLDEHNELIKRCNPKKGDILVSKCGTIGRTKLVDVDYPFSIFVGLALLKTNGGLVSGEYLEQLLNCDSMRRTMEISSPGSTRRTLTIKAIEKLPILLPPLPEQQKIASILSTVDYAIAKTDEIIAKTQQLKKGLMQQLLTKGIGHTKFKQTEIGEIPAHWRLVPLGRTTREPIRNGYSPICPSEPTGKWVLKLSAVSEEGFREDQVKPAPANDSNVDRTRLHQNDILVSRSNTRNLVGLAGMYGGVPSNCSYPDLMMRIRVEESILAPWYLEQWLLHPRVRSFFHSMARGTSGSMVKVDRAIVERLPVPVPPLEEQQEIISVASAAIGKLHGERQTQDALQQLKKGLMQILLTAKIRVKVD